MERGGHQGWLVALLLAAATNREEGEQVGEKGREGKGREGERGGGKDVDSVEEVVTP